MGLEDFGVILRPVQPLYGAAVERGLLGMCFSKISPAAMALPHQAAYVLRDGEKNIEALLRRQPDNENLLDCVSIRYAVCQPAPATQTFLDIVAQFVSEYPLQITGIAPGIEFSGDTLNEFGECAMQKIMAAKSRWSGLFGGDTEEVVLSVADSWKYFLAKHPKALQSERHLVR